MAGYKGAPPPTPSLPVPLKWAKSPRSSSVLSSASHLEQRWGVKVGLRSGPVGPGLGDGERGPDFLSSPSNLRVCFLLVPDSPELQAEAGGLWGCLEREWSERGVPFPLSRGFGAQEQEGPPPPVSGPGGAVTQDPDRPAQLRARHLPLPPACLNLAPASGDPAPPPPTGTGLGEATREGPAWRVGGGLP